MDQNKQVNEQLIRTGPGVQTVQKADICSNLLLPCGYCKELKIKCPEFTKAFIDGRLTFTI